MNKEKIFNIIIGLLIAGTVICTVIGIRNYNKANETKYEPLKLYFPDTCRADSLNIYYRHAN